VAGYYANISWLDAFVGRLLAELETRGLRDDTLIVFVSDNGMGAEQPIAGTGQGKGTLYEMGFRQPIVVSWPGHVPAGVTRTDLVPTRDIAPTLLDYARADALEDGDGRSLRRALETGAPAGRDRIVGSFHMPTPRNNGFWVRTPRWRYLTAADGREELYAIDVDPYEQTDVAALHPDLLEEFRADVAAWQAHGADGRAMVDVAGHIRDENGAALAGETVELRGRSDAGHRIRLRVLTSERGDFLFEAVPAGQYVIRGVTVAGLSSPIGARGLVVWVSAGSLDQFVPLDGVATTPARHPGDAMIRGSVVDASGRPIAGADVSVRGPHVSLTFRTGADGRFRAEWLPSGTYRVTAKAPHHPGRTRTTPSLGAGEERSVDLALAG
jgi:hypothetical protein